MQAITQNDFQTTVLDNKGIVVVDFYTDWCQPCKQLAPILEELSTTMTAVTFVKINAEDAGELAMQYQVRSVPTLIIFKAGQIVEQIMGVQPKETLQEKIKSFH